MGNAMNDYDLSFVSDIGWFMTGHKSYVRWVTSFQERWSQIQDEKFLPLEVVILWVNHRNRKYETIPKGNNIWEDFFPLEKYLVCWESK